MGIAKRGGHCVKAIYLNLSELNIEFLIKHSSSLVNKAVWLIKLTFNIIFSIILNYFSSPPWKGEENVKNDGKDK